MDKLQYWVLSDADDIGIDSLRCLTVSPHTYFIRFSTDIQNSVSQ